MMPSLTNEKQDYISMGLSLTNTLRAKSNPCMFNDLISSCGVNRPNQVQQKLIVNLSKKERGNSEQSLVHFQPDYIPLFCYL